MAIILPTPPSRDFLHFLPSFRARISTENSFKRRPGLRFGGEGSKVVRLEVSGAVGGPEPSRCYIIHGDSVSTC